MATDPPLVFIDADTLARPVALRWYSYLSGRSVTVTRESRSQRDFCERFRAYPSALCSGDGCPRYTSTRSKAAGSIPSFCCALRTLSNPLANINGSISVVRQLQTRRREQPVARKVHVLVVHNSRRLQPELTGWHRDHARKAIRTAPAPGEPQPLTASSAPAESAKRRAAPESRGLTRSGLAACCDSYFPLPRVSPSTTCFPRMMYRTMTGATTMTEPAIIEPHAEV